MRVYRTFKEVLWALALFAKNHFELLEMIGMVCKLIGPETICSKILSPSVVHQILTPNRTIYRYYSTVSCFNFFIDEISQQNTTPNESSPLKAPTAIFHHKQWYIQNQRLIVIRAIINSKVMNNSPLVAIQLHSRCNCTPGGKQRNSDAKLLSGIYGT